MNTFHLSIIACNRIFYDGDAVDLVFPAYDGLMEILAHHAPMTTMVDVGELRYCTPDGTWQKAVVSDGIMEVGENEVKILVYSAEKPEEIDVFRAEAALERAKEQLSGRQSLREYNISRASLARAMARLRLAKSSQDPL